MIKIAFNLFVYVLSFCLHSQINQSLKVRLDSIQKLDQLIRFEVSNVMSNKVYIDSLAKNSDFVMSDYVKSIMIKQESIDQANLKFIDSIVQLYGYPGKSLVGDTTCHTAWYIIQHSDQLVKYYKLIRKASRKGEIPDSLFAKTKDRMLIMIGKKQIFGTQSECYPNDNGSFDCFISPIRNINTVNRRRKKAGFSTTIEVNAILNKNR